MTFISRLTERGIEPDVVLRSALRLFRQVQALIKTHFEREAGYRRRALASLTLDSDPSHVLHAHILLREHQETGGSNSPFDLFLTSSTHPISFNRVAKIPRILEW